jgi:hypothetical protein
MVQRAASIFSAAVRSPSTWAMLLIGFAGIGFAGYRRRARDARTCGYADNRRQCKPECEKLAHRAFLGWEWNTRYANKTVRPQVARIAVTACSTRIRGSIKVPVMPWDELTRSEQRLLIKLFGGGSLRNESAADIEGLRRRGFIDDKQNLSMPGLLVLTLAMREQQAAARRRTGIA